MQVGASAKQFKECLAPRPKGQADPGSPCKRVHLFPKSAGSSGRHAGTTPQLQLDKQFPTHTEKRTSSQPLCPYLLIIIILIPPTLPEHQACGLAFSHVLYNLGSLRGQHNFTHLRRKHFQLTRRLPLWCFLGLRSKPIQQIFQGWFSTASLGLGDKRMFGQSCEL